MKNIILAIVAIAIGVAALWWGVQYKNHIENTPPPPSAESPSTNATTSTTTNQLPIKAMITTPSGLQIEDTKQGTGAEAKSGNSVTVHYVGTLTNGTKFDSSRDRGAPFTFTLGAGDVIKGWDEGVAGMKIGGVRMLTIPAVLAYGATGQGPIPPNATLVFEVELLGVK